ncbi:MAG: YdeI/OmpD-associated family protein [Gemmatimonadaceae bacterium]
MAKEVVRTTQAEEVAFATDVAWSKWLDKNHATSNGVWIVIGKKGSGIASVTHAEALDVALSFGWIDGQRRGRDEKTFFQRFTPRRARSIWSQINRDKAIALTESGRMRPAGAREMDRAKKDGRWDAAYAPQAQAQVPPDLQAALDANKKAATFFATLSSQNRYAILFRIHNAKRAETRARRIADFVAMLARHETLH